jgi:hypothetical protein
MNTIYIIENECGFLLEGENGMTYGTADTKEEAIASAKAYIEMGHATSYCIEE